MAYAVKELFYTLQGEGAQAGRAAVFVRFAGCNLWTGREADRADAVCRFCDTDFVGTNGSGGGRFDDARRLAQAAAEAWRGGSGRPHAAEARRGGAGRPYAVLTGGEPLLQVDAALTAALHDEGFEVAVETNGTKPRPPGLDWVCVSPKASTELVLRSGDELKLVYPQPEAPPERFESLDFRHFLLQPMDGPDVAEATAACIAYCLAHPRWRLSVQMHKVVGIR